MLTLFLCFPRHFMDVGLSVYRQVFYFLRYICMHIYTPTHILTHAYIKYYILLKIFTFSVCFRICVQLHARTQTKKNIHIFKRLRLPIHYWYQPCPVQTGNMLTQRTITSNKRKFLIQGLSLVQYQRVGTFFLQVATPTAASMCLVFQVILLHLYWLPNDLQKSRERRVANV